MALRDAFRATYAFAAPAEDRSLASLHLATAPRELELRHAIAGRVLDGARLAADLAGTDEAASVTFAALGVAFGGGAAGTVDAAGAALRARAAGHFPVAAARAWVPERLDYAFGLSAPEAGGTETRLVADDYAGGRLDWHAFDAVRGATSDAGFARGTPMRETLSLLPAPARFAGAPALRWWEFETSRVGFGLMTASRTDIVKLLLAEFALVAGNDWFLLPVKAAHGELVEVPALVMEDNFGIRSLIEPTSAAQRRLGLAGSWSLWRPTARDAAAGEPPLLFADVLPRSLESRPVERVLFVRDEMANLVWAVEAIIPDALEGGRDGGEAAHRLREAILGPGDAAPAPAPLDGVETAYRLMGTVPENWIPFVAAKLAGQATATMLLQGAMPRIAPDAAVAGGGLSRLVLPRGTILAADPVADPNLIHEAEVLRSGVVIERSFQSARWLGGASAAWSGLTRRNGSGEGASGLAFDALVPGP